MNVRVMGSPDAVTEAIERIEDGFTVLTASDPYPCQGRGCDCGWVRVYLDIREPTGSGVPPTHT